MVRGVILTSRRVSAALSENLFLLSERPTVPATAGQKGPATCGGSDLIRGVPVHDTGRQYGSFRDDLDDIDPISTSCSRHQPTDRKRDSKRAPGCQSPRRGHGCLRCRHQQTPKVECKGPERPLPRVSGATPRCGCWQSQRSGQLKTIRGSSVKHGGNQDAMGNPLENAPWPETSTGRRTTSNTAP